jgi:carboxypeptidase C (cathepsin A)
MVTIARICLLCLATFGLVVSSGMTLAQDAKPAAAVAASGDEPVVTHHQISVHGKTLNYTARAGFLSIRDEEQTVHGRMFYVAYTLDQPAGSAPRPLIFAWNGGPGSNAALLELGAFGPVRIDKKPGASEPDHRYPLIDNEDTWLQFADLVFVDPIGTGYSYAATPDDLKGFFNDQGDADSVAEFIRLYRIHYAEQQAPLFIMGESYGTFRAAGVAEILAQRRIPLEGAIVLSCVFNFDSSHDPGLSSVFLLPNYTATAFAHHRLNAELQKDLARTVDQAQHWAETDYLAALLQGDRLPEAQKKAIAQQLEHFTGIASDVWLKANLKLDPDAFADDVLGPKTTEYVGHYDTTIVGKLAHPGEPYNVAEDPSLDNGVEGVIYPYLRDDLGFKTDAFYRGPFGGAYPSPAGFRGDWTSVRWNRGVQEADRGAALADALKKTPQLRIFVGHGYFDLSTPFAATEYTISHLDLTPEERQRIVFTRYEGGHAAYIAPAVRMKMEKDVQAFVLGGKSR